MVFNLCRLPRTFLLNFGKANPAIYRTSNYNASTVGHLGRTFPVSTGGVFPDNYRDGNMAFQGRYNIRTYNARKL